MRAIFRAALNCAAFSLLYVDTAFAATIDFGGVFGSASQYLSAFVDTVITGAVGWLAYKLNSKFHVDIEKGHRDALEAWLKRQAGSLLADGAAWVSVHGKIEVKSDALAAAASVLMNSIPDAAKFFGLTPDSVRNRIVDMIPQVPNAPALLAANVATPPLPTAILSGAKVPVTPAPSPI